MTAVGEATILQLEFDGAYAAASILAAIVAHAVPGLERADAASGSVTRLISTSQGPVPATVSISPERIELSAVTADTTALTEVVAVVHRWLDLDAEPARISAALSADPLLAPLVRARPGLRVLGSVDGFETAVTTVLGQQVSLAAARTFAGRLVAAYGLPAPDAPPTSTGAPSAGAPNAAVSPDALRTFPTPARLAAATPDELQQAVGLTGARSRTVHALAEACASGLHIAPGGDHAETRARLLALPGIGPWTVDYLALRALGDRDACPAGDLVLRRALGVATSAAVLERAAAWSPLRAYAVFHLWTHAAYVA